MNVRQSYSRALELGNLSKVWLTGRSGCASARPTPRCRASRSRTCSSGTRSRPRWRSSTGMGRANNIHCGAATCSEGFLICFLKLSLAGLGSMADAVQPNSLGTLRKHVTKPSEQVAASPSRLWGICSVVGFYFVFFRKFRSHIGLRNSCSISLIVGGTCQKSFTKHHN